MWWNFLFITVPLAFDCEHVVAIVVLGRKNRCKTMQKRFTERDSISLHVRGNFHYAFSCTRLSAVHYCTNMGQPVFDLFFAHLVRFGTVVLLSICIDFVSIFIDFCG